MPPAATHRPARHGLRREAWLALAAAFVAYALLIATGACILTRTPMALRESFSARAFWPDVQRYGATAMIYIGELCRYLINSPESPAEKNNPLQVAVGNGLRADVWEVFQKRFDVPRIREARLDREQSGARA